MNGFARMAIRAYPPSFRERYGSELATLVDDMRPSPRWFVDLLIGATRAWLRPAFTGPDARRRRLQATLGTTWVAWCAGFLVAPAVDRALLDPPTTGVTPAVRDLLAATQVLFVIGWALVLLGSAPIVLRSVLPALRTRSWAAVWPLLVPLVLGVADAAGLAALAVSSHSSLASRVGALIWLIGFVGFLACLGLAPAVSLDRLAPQQATLRLPTALAAPVALVLTAMTACSIAAASVAGNGRLLGSAAPVVAALVVAGAASITAATSSVRGVRALRSL